VALSRPEPSGRAPTAATAALARTPPHGRRAPLGSLARTRATSDEPMRLGKHDPARRRRLALRPGLRRIAQRPHRAGAQRKKPAPQRSCHFDMADPPCCSAGFGLAMLGLQGIPCSHGAKDPAPPRLRARARARAPSSSPPDAPKVLEHGSLAEERRFSCSPVNRALLASCSATSCRAG
jgi:hypothetical protein